MNVVYALILTLELACVDIAFRNFQKAYVYILMFIVILIGMVLFHSDARVCEHTYTYEALEEINFEYNLKY